MNAVKVIFLILIFNSSYIFAQSDLLIVRGKLKGGSQVGMSKTFIQNQFIFLKGNYTSMYYDKFNRFSVDSIINGIFINSHGDTLSAPFDIILGSINECIFIEYHKSLTLELKQFPNTNVYYIDKINQITPNEHYQEKVDNYYKEYISTVGIFSNGTHQQIKNSLDKTNSNNQWTIDRRYIKHIIPLMKSKDEIIDFTLLFWDGVDSLGNMVGGTDSIFEKRLFADYLYHYLKDKIPFELPPNSNSTNWEQWYESLLSKDCFEEIKYAESTYKEILNPNYLRVFLTNTFSNSIFIYNKKPIKLDLETDKLKFLSENSKQSNTLSFLIDTYTQINDEILFFYGSKIIQAKANDSTFCITNRIKIDKFKNGRNNKIEYASDMYALKISNKIVAFWGEAVSGKNSLFVSVVDILGNFNNTVLVHSNKFKSSYDCNYLGLNVINLSDTSFVVSYTIDDYQKRNHTGLFLKIINTDLETTDSSETFIDFPTFDYRITETYLAKNDSKILVLYKTRHNSGESELYYQIYDKNLKPLTEIVFISKHIIEIARPISINSDFIITWTDNSLHTKSLRSVLIDKNQQKSKITNISSGEISLIYNVGFTDNIVDFYMISSSKFIRKRVNLYEY